MKVRVPVALLLILVGIAGVLAGPVAMSDAASLPASDIPIVSAGDGMGPNGCTYDEGPSICPTG